MIRPLRPTDVLAYLAFRRQLPDSEALTRADGTTTLPTMRAFLGGSFALEPQRSRWVAVERGRITGLVAARARLGADVWDVDQLMAAPSADVERLYVRLLEHLCAEAVEAGVHKVFLRLHEESEALAAARQAGFFRFTTEYIYCHPGAMLPPLVVPEGLRPRRPADHQALFQLYTAVVPAYVRQVEGLTLQEWRWTDGWRQRPMPWRRRRPRRRDYVADRGDGIAAWLQVEVRDRLLTLLTADREELARRMIAFGLANLGPGGPIVLPLREYQAELHSCLEEQAFALVGRHALLARALASRVPEGKLMPARAS